MKAVFSLFFWGYLALSSMVLFFVALAIWLVTLPFDRNGRIIHLFTCAWSAHYLYFNPLWKVRIEGARNADRRSAYVIVANHQSFGDILAIAATYLPFKWVSKQSVFKMPFIGWNMALNGYVPIVRGDKESAERMFAKCRRWIERGVSVVFFPEGTRSKDGEIKDFKPGAFKLALDTGAQILPILLDGTRDTLPKHGFVLRKGIDARVRVLHPIAPRATVAETSDHVRAVMIEELTKMRACGAQLPHSEEEVSASGTSGADAPPPRPQ
jgi:1-acyl-sn-glycerol-3-phosphate acyltransferase